MITRKKCLRVIVFGSIEMHLLSHAIAKALLPYASVKKVHWRYKQIPNKAHHAVLKIVYRPFEFLYWSLRIFKELHRFHADIIFAEYGYVTGLIGIMAAIVSRKKCVIYCVGSDLKLNSRTILGESLVSWELKKSTGTICVSKDLENIAKLLGAKNVITIPPPIDFADCDEQDFRKDWDIISIAALKHVKALSYLIRAMKSLNDCKLVIVGDGPERDNLETLSLKLRLNHRVFFLGQVDHRMIWNYLQRANVFVLPSVSEGCPRAIIEAMGCGLPIVATDVGGIPEVVTNGVNGFLVPSRNVEALVEAIEKLLEDFNLRKKISTENRKKAKKYEMRIIGQKMYDYLRSIA